MDQLCYQLSYANVKITPFTSCANVFDFMNEFELATAGLSDEQRLTLLAKGFPHGRYRSWFENELQPLVDGKGSWKQAKEKLRIRSSGPTDQDRHFKRLRELNFDPKKDKTLTEFVDDLIYIYRKAHDGHGNDELLVKHIKASLPPEVVTSLCVYPDYREAVTSAQLKKAILEYDLHRESASGQEQGNRSTLTEFATMFKNLIESMKQEQEATRNIIVAAFKSQEDRQNSPPVKHHEQRDKSPSGRVYQPQTMQNNRPNHRYSRSPTPPRSIHYNDRSSPRSRSPNNNYNNRQYTQNSNDRKKNAFDTEAYYQRFGEPPSPCNHCGMLHWSRHCHLTLN